MSGSQRGGESPVRAGLRSSASPRLEVADRVVLDVLAAAAAAGSAHALATSVLATLAQLEGVRAGALVRSARAGLTVVGSVGYECGVFEPGGTLDPAAGLPVTECARTGRTVVQGAGPGWVAVPVGAGGALLLSLTAAPPVGEDLQRLERLGRPLASALTRALRADLESAELLVVEAALAVRAALPTGLDVAVRNQPYRGSMTGDVVEVVADGDGHWLLVADVSGRGAAAAVSAVRARAAFHALVPETSSPAGVLGALERALLCGEEDFVTAVVAHVSAGLVRVASAGHPAPITVEPSGQVRPLIVRPGPPLGMAGSPWVGEDTSYDVAPGTLLVFHTDGLVDRGAEVDLGAVLRRLGYGTTDAVADRVVAACDEVGRRSDDVTLLVARL